MLRRVAQNLAELTVLRGDLEKAEAFARQALDLAERSSDKEADLTILIALGLLYGTSGGPPQEAEEFFRQAEALEPELDPEEPYLYSIRGFQFCELLLDQEGYREVLTRASQHLALAQKCKGSSTSAWSTSPWGRPIWPKGLKKVRGTWIRPRSILMKRWTFSGGLEGSTI